MSEPSRTPTTLKGAADRLNAALKGLDRALDPVLTRLSRAETKLTETQGFGEDRARLASELDEATARTRELESRLSAREEEFAALSRDTRAELDDTIGVLRDVLSGG